MDYHQKLRDLELELQGHEGKIADFNRKKAINRYIDHTWMDNIIYDTNYIIDNLLDEIEIYREKIIFIEELDKLLDTIDFTKI